METQNDFKDSKTDLTQSVYFGTNFNTITDKVYN